MAIREVKEDADARRFWYSENGPAFGAHDVYNRALTGDLVATTFYWAWRSVMASPGHSGNLQLAKFAWCLYTNSDYTADELIQTAL